MAAAAELKSVLVGVPLPAEKARLLEYAVQQRAEPLFLEALRSLPDREYESLDEVMEALAPVQAHRMRQAPRSPKPESGDPPGGSDYVKPRD